MRFLCNRLALHTTEPVPEGADPHIRRFFWLPMLCAVTPASDGRVLLSTRNVARFAGISLRSDALPLEGDSFRATGSPPHTSEPVEGAVPHTNRRPFSLAALNSDRQRRHAKNNENDNHKGAQHPQMKFPKHWQPHKLESIDDVYFQAKSSELQRS